MTRREKKIYAMLEHYLEAADTLSTSALVAMRKTDDAGLSHPERGMDRVFNDSYRQLDSLLARMASEEPVLHRHVSGRFKLKTRRRTEVYKRGARYQIQPNEHVVAAYGSTTTKKGKATKVGVVLEKWPEWVNGVVVLDGVTWLAKHFEGEPILHEEIRDA